AAVTPPTSPDPPSAAAPAAPEAAAPAALTALSGELAPDRCGLAIDSQPEGAEVSIGGELAGQTPLRLELPCRTHEVVVRRVRYSDATRTVELRPGRMETVRVDLARPEHRLRIVSTPKGARVTVAGRDEGSAPALATVSGYEQVTVRVEREGYRPWSKKVYARKATTTVTARLERIAKPAAAKPAARKAPATAPRKKP
ncbi:MAG TPA: PEGA domain-containing protein, partial [Kofleriaceae bacterium]|nr:PEGA domain-containing protein [Kofleriaceae bacterium]